jgi:hypothetical protein
MEQNLRGTGTELFKTYVIEIVPGKPGRIESLATPQTYDFLVDRNLALGCHMTENCKAGKHARTHTHTHTHTHTQKLEKAAECVCETHVGLNV